MNIEQIKRTANDHGLTPVVYIDGEIELLDNMGESSNWTEIHPDLNGEYNAQDVMRAMGY